MNPTTIHTPGPWHVNTCPNPDYLRVSNDTGKLTIVNVSVPESIPLSERNANAHLIAAAPELLEALEQLLLDNTLEAELIRLNHKRDDTMDDQDARFLWAIQKAKAAIAKATQQEVKE